MSADMDSVPFVTEPGDTLVVKTADRHRFSYANGFTSTRPGDELIVNRPGETGAYVRRATGGNIFYISYDEIEREPVRKLGETPDGETIALDDPRLDWIWRDFATFAERKGWCSQYDALCDQMGIPGRERNFTVKREVNGISMSAQFTATSRAQAEAMFDTALANGPRYVP